MPFDLMLVILGIFAVVLVYNIRSGSAISRSMSDRQMAAFAKIPYWSHTETDHELMTKAIHRIMEYPNENMLDNKYYHHYMLRKSMQIQKELREEAEPLRNQEKDI